jgi:hypothetical protein
MMGTMVDDMSGRMHSSRSASVHRVGDARRGSMSSFDRFKCQLMFGGVRCVLRRRLTGANGMDVWECQLDGMSSSDRFK